MSRFSGRQGRGAMKNLRGIWRREADERNTKTPPERRRDYRRRNAA